MDMNMSKKVINRKELTPIEKGVRNSVIWHLNDAGFNIGTIANVLNMNQSTVSRVVSNKPERTKLLDTILWGTPMSQTRE